MTISGPTRKYDTLSKRNKGANKDSYVDCVYWKQNVGSSPYITSTFNKMSERNFWYLKGWDVPNFHARREKGELIVQTPFYLFRQYGHTEGVKDELNVNSTPNKMAWCYDHIYYDYWLPTEEYVAATYLEPSVTDRYVQEAAAAIYSSGHDTLTFLAELTEVRHMFVETGKRLLKLSSIAPKGWKGMSCDWLSYRYGWRTLVYDLQDLNEAVTNLNDGRNRRSVRKGHTTKTTSYDSWDVDHGFGIRQHQYLDTVEIGLRGSVVADIEIPDFQFNPLITGWEIVPFSFVIDWFVSIGKSLAAICFLGQASSYTASYGISVKVHREYEFNIQWASGYSGTDYQNGESWTEIHKRIPCTIPFLPHFRVNLDPKKILDLLGLVIQRK
jgi:hypothetical protein